MLRKEHRGKLHVDAFINDFLDILPKAQETEAKVDKLLFNKIEYLCIKTHYQESKKATHRMR